MIATIVAIVISIASGVAIYFAAQWGLFFAGLTAGGITTILTIAWLFRIIGMLKKAIILGRQAHETERRIHLFTMQRIKSAVEKSKTQKHRDALLKGMGKYVTDLTKEVRGGPQIIQLAKDHD